MDVNILEEIRKMVFVGDDVRTLELVQKALDDGHDPHDITDNGLVKGIQDCGVAYEEQLMWLPELMMAADALKKALAVLKPKMSADAGDGRGLGKVVLATVQGDVHDIGVELVGVMLESSGFSVRFMGGNVPTPEIIAAVKEDKAELLGLSTLLSNTMHVLPEVLKILEGEGLRESVKVMVGGAVIRQEYCEEIGADGYAADAVNAVPLAKKLRGLS
jgi:5-methyltetrahydrofolate--homocysteine methyltransferase